MSGIIEIDITKTGSGNSKQFYITVDDGTTPIKMGNPQVANGVVGNNALVLNMNTMIYNFDEMGNETPSDFKPYVDSVDNKPLMIDKPACYHITNSTGMGIMVFHYIGSTTISETVNTNSDTYIQLDSNGNTTGFSDTRCCVHQYTKILTNHGYKCIKDIDSTNEVKIQNVNGDFIDLLYNIRYIPTNKFIMISKDSLGQNMPSEDLYIVEGHPLNIDGNEILCDDLINDDTIKKVVLDKPVFVYSLCAKERVPVKMNNVFVYTWEQNEWESYASKHKIGYIKL